MILNEQINKFYKFFHNVKQKQLLLKIHADHKKILSEYKSQRMLQDNNFLIPHIYFFDNNSIQMEYLEHDLNNVNLYNIILKELSSIHKIKNNSFGNYFDTYVANNKVCNSYQESWTIFFKHQRWLHLFDTTNENYHSALQVANVMDKIFIGQNIIPSLLHGNAHYQNFIVNDEKVYLIDSACFFGDPNYDIACFEYSIGIKKEEPWFKLYYAYILSVKAKSTCDDNYNKLALEYMKEILEIYDDTIKL